MTVLKKRPVEKIKQRRLYNVKTHARLLWHACAPLIHMSQRDFGRMPHCPQRWQVGDADYNNDALKHACGIQITRAAEYSSRLLATTEDPHGCHGAGWDPGAGGPTEDCHLTGTAQRPKKTQSWYLETACLFIAPTPAERHVIVKMWGHSEWITHRSAQSYRVSIWKIFFYQKRWGLKDRMRKILLGYEECQQ